jgi:PAS domain-containing protein
MTAAPSHAAQDPSGFESRHFGIDDIFYSRTDRRGIILAANAVFQRVSVYDWADLIGAPHNVIRHPDMPRGVFHLMWSMLADGKPFCGYIKNKAEDGSHYWVLAVACPLEEGFVSVRIKPGSQMFRQAQQMYIDLCHRERNEGLSPEASSAAFLTAVQMAGHGDYDSFMTQALTEETRQRDIALQRPVDWRLRSILSIKEGVKEIEDHAGDVVRIFRQTNQIPYNMRLQAGRLEGTDGPISVISNNHRQMTQSLADAVATFSEKSLLGNDYLLQAEFLHGVSRVQHDLLQHFAVEPVIEGQDKPHEMALLSGQQSDFICKAHKAVVEVSDRVCAFSKICNDVRRLKAGLEMTRVMCKIERSRIAERVDGLDEIVQQLGKAQTDLDVLLSKMDGAVQQILEAAERLTQSRQKAA